MLTDVHRITPRARAVLGHSRSGEVIRAVAVSSPKLGHNQQTRHYHFGMWSSYPDPESHRNVRHPQGAGKHRFAEHLSKIPTWDQIPATKDPRVVLKRIIENHSQYGKPSCSRNLDTPSTYDGEAGNSPKKIPWMNTPIRSQFNDIFHSWMNPAANGAKQATSDAVSRHSEAKAHASLDHVGGTTTKGAQEDDDYVIDPITNRKVSRVYGSSYGRPERPVPTFESYRSQFTPFSPHRSEAERPVVHSDGPPPADELRKYTQVDIDPNPADASSSVQNTTTVAPGEHQAYRNQTVQNEEYSPNHLPPDKPGETYHDLHKYKPYMRNEPDGSPKEDGTSYDDLHEYTTPYMYNEGVPAEDGITKYDDLDKYGPYMYKEDVKPEESSPKYNDLDQYGPYMYQEDMKSEESPRDPELDRYGPYMYKEDSNREDPTPKYDDIHKYNPTEFDDPTSATSEQPFSQYGDLDQYKKFRHHDADGDLGKEMSTASKPSISERLQKLDLAGAEPQDEADLPFKTSTSDRTTASRDDLESAMDSHREASDATDRGAFANVRESRARKEDEVTEAGKPTTTVNSFWDFLARRDSYLGRPAPEDEALKDQSSYTTMPKVHVTVEGGKPSASRLETALDRQKKASSDSRIDRRAREEAEVDPYSTERQGLETSYAEECGGKPTWPTFVQTYVANQDADSRTAKQRTAEETAAASDSTQAASSEEPTVYKILAYDPATKDISTAETTSTVPPHEEATAPLLTPADVLPRLSNPSQFMSHFAPLQAEGFEIASGAGDVLVFRKVNRSPDSTITTTTTRDAKTYHHQQQPPVNPIDMMGRPAPLPSAAAFASPTGFLNYDLPTASTAPAPAPATTEAAATLVERGEARTTSPTSLNTPAATTAGTAASYGTGASIESGSNAVNNASIDHPINESTTNKPLSQEEVEDKDYKLSDKNDHEHPEVDMTKVWAWSFGSIGGTILLVELSKGQKERRNRHRQQRQREEEDKKRVAAKLGKSILVAASCVAGFSYVLGVLADYFITGGMDGRGPVGL